MRITLGSPNYKEIFADGGVVVSGGKEVARISKILATTSNSVVAQLTQTGDVIHEAGSRIIKVQKCKQSMRESRIRDYFLREAHIAQHVSRESPECTARIFDVFDQCDLVAESKSFSRSAESRMSAIGAMTMDHLHGETLTSYVRRRVDNHTYDECGMGEMESLEVLLSAGEVLGAVHNQGYVHRDVKPCNFMLSDTCRRVRLIDFGFSTEIKCDGLVSPGVIFGTPGYMSPEHVELSDNDPSLSATEQSDLFGLGFTLYSMHFNGGCGPTKDYGDWMDILKKMKGSKIAIPEERRSSSLVPIVQKLTAYEPEKRYQSTRELCDDVKSTIDAKLLEEFHLAVRGSGWKLFDRMKAMVNSFAGIL